MKRQIVCTLLTIAFAATCRDTRTADTNFSTPPSAPAYLQTPAYQFEPVPDQLTLLTNLMIMQTELMDAAEGGKRSIELPIDDDVITESIELCSRLKHATPQIEWQQLANGLAGSRATWCSGCGFLNDLNNVRYWLNQIQLILDGQAQCLALCTKLIGATDHSDGQPYIGTTGFALDSTWPGGRYCLREYVLLPGDFSGASAITATRNDVVIDLSGNTINGNGVTDVNGIKCYPTDCTGGPVCINPYWTVENGTITNCDGTALLFSGSGDGACFGSTTTYPYQLFRDLVLTESNNGLSLACGQATVERVQADRNSITGSGFFAQYCQNTTFLDCRARGNNTSGFIIDGCSTEFERCTAIGNLWDGFDLLTNATLSHLHNCIAIQNSDTGFKVSAAICATTNFARSNGTNYSGLGGAFTAQNMAGLASYPFGANIDGDL